MSDDESARRDDTKSAIMEATYEVLARDGHEALTTERIAAACDRSQGVVHYHYETKQDLLVSFIDYLLERRTETFPDPDGDPSTRLAAALSNLLPERLDDDRRRYAEVSIELHAQARHNDRYRERLERRDRRVRARLADIVRDGIDTGQFRAVKPESFAFRVLAIADGAILRAVSLDDEAALETGRRELERAVRTDLIAAGRSWELETSAN